MNEYLNEESRKSLVEYRIERAHNTLNEISVLLDNGLYSTAINRLYYAVYYAAIALLVNDGHEVSSHAGVRTLLGLHYVKPGKISRDIGQNFMILFERRHRCDYDDFIESSKEEVTSLVPLAESFIQAIESLL